ncbi:penicillin-binding protein [Candidatus Roizmanbacteria bacterium]|nr:penicillin-binding protein [Candidatus Roizmanbacteria bacterium]
MSEFTSDVVLRIFKLFFSLGKAVQTLVVLLLFLFFQVGYIALLLLHSIIEFVHRLIDRILAIISVRTIAFSAVLIFLIAGSVVYVHFMLSIPNPKTLRDFTIPAAILIYDRNNILLYSAYSQNEHDPLRFSDIPPILIKAVLAQEDSRFFKHKGFDLVQSLFSKKPTVTQKLAKNFFLGGEKTFANTLRGVVTTIRLEQSFSKNQILEIYLHTRSFGNVASGVQAAAQLFFNKSVKDLSDAEALFLVSEQIENVSDKEKVESLVDRMIQLKMIPRRQKAAIMSQSYAAQPHSRYKRAPVVVESILAKLEKEYGKEYLQRNGAVVKTTIDITLQNKIQRMVIEKTQSAVIIAVSPIDGSILAMVGSDPSNGIATRIRQEMSIPLRLVATLFDYHGNPFQFKNTIQTDSRLPNKAEGQTTIAVRPTTIVGIRIESKQANPDGMNALLEEVVALSEQKDKTITKVTN